MMTLKFLEKELARYENSRNLDEFHCKQICSLVDAMSKKEDLEARKAIAEELKEQYQSTYFSLCDKCERIIEFLTQMIEMKKKLFALEGKEWEEEKLEVKNNNCMVKEWCPLCGDEMEAEVPVWVFLKGTSRAVCRACVKKLNPELLDEVERRAKEIDPTGIWTGIIL